MPDSLRSFFMFFECYYGIFDVLYQELKELYLLNELTG